MFTIDEGIKTVDGINTKVELNSGGTKAWICGYWYEPAALKRIATAAMRAEAYISTRHVTETMVACVSFLNGMVCGSCGGTGKFKRAPKDEKGNFPRRPKKNTGPTLRELVECKVCGGTGKHKDVQNFLKSINMAGVK